MNEQKNFPGVTHYTHVDVQPGGINIQNVENLYQADFLKGLGIELEVKKTGGRSSEEMPEDNRLARAIEQCQAYFWGNSSYAVLFCLLRDEYGMADNMSMFESMVEQLPYSKERTCVCPKGTIANAFSNNPIYRQPLSRWKDRANSRITILLEKLREQLEL